VFGIMAFVYSGHGVFPSVRASMKKPEQFPKASSSPGGFPVPESCAL
jgi:amino acid permease